MKTLTALIVFVGFAAQAQVSTSCKGMQGGNLHTAPTNPSVKTASGGGTARPAQSVKSDSRR